MKKLIMNICATVVATVVAIVLTLSIVFGVKEIPATKMTALTSSDGNEVATYNIYDIGSLNRLRYAYYTPDEFIVPSSEQELAGEPIDLYSQKDIAARGTYRFVISNLDPNEEDFKDKSQALAPYLRDDNQWHFTMYVPQCFSACCIYVRSVLVNRSGDIENYDYIAYSDKSGYSETHSTATEPFLVDLSFYTRRAAIGETFQQRANIVTVHYEAAQGKTAGFTEAPIIGSESAISDMVANDKLTMTVIAVAAAYVFAVLAFICFLKRSLISISYAAMALGIAGMTFFKLMTVSATTVPYFLQTVIPVCAGFIALAAIFSLACAIKSHRTDLFIPFPIVVVLIISLACTQFVTPVITTPVLWLSVLLLCIASFSAFKFFIVQEKRNIYLTNNLQDEVTRQTTHLQNIVNERDSLLRYLSHDLKKPVMSAQRFVAEIRKDEENAEHIKALNVINQKLDGVQNSLAELQRFAKLNFTAEKAEVCDVYDILENTLPRIEPDCEANGIVLTYGEKHISVFVKRNTLNSVLNNIVFNAIEHADCKQIQVSVSKFKGKCLISVKDDGKGIESERDVFLPYYSDSSDSENLGLGLYICRQHMLAMGGELNYTRENGKTVFTITVPLS